MLALISVEGGRDNGLGGGIMDLVESFQYLASIFSSDGDLYGELSGCLAKAAKMFGCLQSVHLC